MKDWTKATKLRDPDGNIVPCSFERRESAHFFWVRALGVCYRDGKPENRGVYQLILFKENGKHFSGRKYTLILEEEGTTDMKKATFTSTAPVQKPTHWRNKDTGSIMWKTGGSWNRIRADGQVEDHFRILTTPEKNPSEFESLYGDLVITISAEG